MVVAPTPARAGGTASKGASSSGAGQALARQTAATAIAAVTTVSSSQRAFQVLGRADASAFARCARARFRGAGRCIRIVPSYRMIDRNDHTSAVVFASRFVPVSRGTRESDECGAALAGA